MKVYAQLSSSQPITSTLADGKAPFVLTSRTLVTNLNADLLDGLDSSNFALTNHGNHVPTLQTANNAVFLRNDNSWQTVTPANIGAAASSHTHIKSQITDFPTLATVATSGSYNDLSNKLTTMVGANGTTAGATGLVPAPAATESKEFLRGDATWQPIVTSVNGSTGDVGIVVPTRTSQLTNDSGFLTSAPVTSVNGKTGAVSLTYSDVSAVPLAGGVTMTGVLTAQSNASYTTRQVRNIILSTADAALASMSDGDVWIKYV